MSGSKHEREERNAAQIIRKDARGCFVESLNDMFDRGKIHLNFAAYDMSRPPGERQTNCVNLYIDAGEFLELCHQLSSGEMRYLWQVKRKSGDSSPIREWLGGTSAAKLALYGRPRADGKSLSRTSQLYCGRKSDFLFSASSGAGEEDSKGLIVPRFGKNPENHVAVSMSWRSLSELLLLTKAHYEAWLGAWYLAKVGQTQQKMPIQRTEQKEEYLSSTPEISDKYYSDGLF